MGLRKRFGGFKASLNSLKLRAKSKAKKREEQSPMPVWEEEKSLFSTGIESSFPRFKELPAEIRLIIVRSISHLSLFRSHTQIVLLSFSSSQAGMSFEGNFRSPTSNLLTNLPVGTSTPRTSNRSPRAKTPQNSTLHTLRSRMDQMANFI